MKAITQEKPQESDSRKVPKPARPEQLPDDNRDDKDSSTDWNAENNESGRRK